MAIRVGIVDYHRLLLLGMSECLDQADGIKVVETATDIASALRVVGADQPDVLIVNVDFPRSAAIGLCHQVHNVFPAIALLAIAEHPNLARTRLLESVGVLGYVETTLSPAALVAAVRMVAEGERVYSAQAVQGLGDAPAALTSREVQVLELLAAGHSNVEIASALGVAGTTAEFHVGNVLAKLGARSRLDAVAKAQRAGLLPPYPDAP